MKSKSLCDKIIDQIFIPGGPGVRRRADRIALIVNGRDACGWGEGPLRDKIQEIIDRHVKESFK